MVQNKNKIVAAATAAGACVLSAQLFVLPSSQSRQPLSAEQVAAVARTQAPAASSSSALPLVGLAAAGAIFAVNRGTRAEKVTRQFFGGGGGSTYKSFDPATEGGVQDPVGFWDPLGLAADKDEATFKRRRAVEIKHGRIAMYATIGYIVPEYYKFPGDLSPSQGIKFADVPNGLAAFSKVPLFGWLQMFAFAGLIETSGFFSGQATAIGFQKDSTMDGEPGNYGVGFPNFIGKVTDPAARASKLNAELANGRLAMMAIIGMFFQDGLTGSAWGDWALYTASPLRAFESELGVQAPVGFWDPLGFTADGDVAAFRRRRSVELKHGRIAMLATMGYITPELIGKFPGELSPSAGLKYSDIPNGLAAVAKVPALGWVQILAYFGFVEFSGGFEDYKSGTPGDYGWKVLTSSDEAEKTKKLSAEIANGRLAMAAIIGMFFQDGLTGQAWGDWALYTASPLRFWEHGSGADPNAPFAGGLVGGQSGHGGQYNFDPLKLAAEYPTYVPWFREAELKHGRVAMLAFVGIVAQENIRLPLDIFQDPSLNVVSAHNKLIGPGFAEGPMWWLMLFCGAIESIRFKQLGLNFSGLTLQSAGDLDFGKGFLPKTEEGVTQMKLKELRNGRLAMLAFGGIITQAALWDKVSFPFA